MSARDMSRRGTVGGGRARFQPRARGANRSFRGRGSAFLSVSSCFSSRKPAFDWELLPLLSRFVKGAPSCAQYVGPTHAAAGPGFGSRSFPCESIQLCPFNSSVHGESECRHDPA